MIARVREQIQHRLEQALCEADRLRKALAALDPRSAPEPARKPRAPRKQSASRARSSSSRPRTTPSASKTAAPTASVAEATRVMTTAQARPATPATASGRPAPENGKTSAAGAPATPATVSAAPSPRRTAPGSTRTAVLATLAGGQSMTAAEVADKAGLPRGSVSTTLTRLARSGEVERADRGYRLPKGQSASPATGEPSESAPATPTAPGE
jgi:hypothetical protein